MRELLLLQFVCLKKGLEEYRSCNQSAMVESNFARISTEKAAEWNLRYFFFNGRGWGKGEGGTTLI